MLNGMKRGKAGAQATTPTRRQAGAPWQLLEAGRRELPHRQECSSFCGTLESHLLPHLGQHDGKAVRVLDVGYGYLEELLAIGEFAGRTGLRMSKLVGLERNVASHVRAVRDMEREPHDGRLALVEGDAAEARAVLGRESFDLVILRHPRAYAHSGHFEGMIEGLKEVAAPGALFFMTFYFDMELEFAKKAMEKAGFEILEAGWMGSRNSMSERSDYFLVSRAP